MERAENQLILWKSGKLASCLQAVKKKRWKLRESRLKTRSYGGKREDLMQSPHCMIQVHAISMTFSLHTS